jgi:hypothetical protein
VAVDSQASGSVVTLFTTELSIGSGSTASSRDELSAAVDVL